MVAAYLRYSTSHQDEMQQIQALREWANANGITIDEIVKDEGVSGGVSFRNRHLNDLVKRLQPGDTLIVSELSRLGRAMGDVSSLLNDELKPRKVRIVIIKSGIDVNCANMKASDEFIFSALSFAAQVEKELIQARTQSAIDARKEAIAKNGGFISKSGRWCKKLGREKGAENENAIAAAALAKARETEKWKKSSPLYSMVKYEVAKGTPHKQILAIAEQFYKDNPTMYSTRKGCKLGPATLSRWMQEIRFGM